MLDASGWLKDALVSDLPSMVKDAVVRLSKGLGASCNELKPSSTKKKNGAQVCNNHYMKEHDGWLTDMPA